MSRRKTHKEFIKECGPLLEEFLVLSEYESAHKKIKVKHIQCGNEFMVTPSHFLNGRGCRRCSYQKRFDNMKKSYDDWVTSLPKKYDGWEFSGYTKVGGPVTAKCPKCGRETVYVKAKSFSSGNAGCRVCGGMRNIENVRRECAARGFELISACEHEPYKKQLFKVKCNVCGKISARDMSNVRVSGCKYCKRYASKAELEIKQKLEDVGVNVESNNRSVIYPYELDMYMPDHNVAVEYDGLFWHSDHPLARKSGTLCPEKRHITKTMAANAKGIRLVHVFEDEWVHSPDIVMDKILSTLKVGEKRKIYARKTEVCVLNSEDAGKFLDENHIQGRARKTVAVGLKDGGELVAVQTFLNEGNGKWELNRYATKLGCVVIGGFTKCLREFERVHSPKLVETFADLRWSAMSGNLYDTTGFKATSRLRPSYWYVSGTHRIHKANFRKNKIAKKFPNVYSPNKTEKQMMQEAGYQRIYDCGMIKYVKKFT